MIYSLKELKDIKRNVVLADYTTWKVGGPVKYFWEPRIDDLPSVLEYCHNKQIPVWFLGRGSNVLIDSSGLDGLVICTKRSLQNIVIKDDVITAEAGVPMPKLSKFAANLGWGGYEYLIGIPGSIGAGIAINAGLTANGRKEIGDVLIDVKLMDKKGNCWWEKKEELELAYRSSNILKRELFVIKARFKSTYKSTVAEIKNTTVKHLSERKRKQPLSKSTAGSTFKQPKGGKAAGWYIDKAGLKGFQIGGAKVSTKHANWIENTGAATSKEILSLIDHIKKEVEKKYSIILKKEVSIIKNE